MRKLLERLEPSKKSRRLAQIVQPIPKDRPSAWLGIQTHIVRGPNTKSCDGTIEACLTYISKFPVCREGYSSVSLDRRWYMYGKDSDPKIQGVTVSLIWTLAKGYRTL